MSNHAPIRNRSVAIIAKIKSVKREISTTEDYTSRIFIAKGNFINILFIRNNSLELNPLS